MEHQKQRRCFMEEVNKAYKKWDKERTEEAKELWYEAVRRFSKIHGDKNE